MKNILLTSIVILLLLSITMLGCGQTEPENGDRQEYQFKGDEQFTIVNNGFTLNEGGAGTLIPYGSTIYHWDNGITEVYGPDNVRILIVKDSECPMVPSSIGVDIPATRHYHTPNNSAGDTEGNTMWIYTDWHKQTVILTIVDYTYDNRDENGGNISPCHPPE
jgi:hypothetical protein